MVYSQGHSSLTSSTDLIESLTTSDTFTTMTEQKTDNWLMLNAIECWLHYFPDHQWVPQYITLRDALKELVDKENQPIEEVEKKDLISSRQTKTKSTITDK